MESSVTALRREEGAAGEHYLSLIMFSSSSSISAAHRYGDDS